MAQKKISSKVGLVLGITIPHHNIMALQHLLAMICSIGEQKFVNWFTKTFGKSYGDNITQEEIDNLKRLGGKTYGELTEIAAPVIANTALLPINDVVLHFRQDDALGETPQDSMESLFDDVDFGDFEIN